MGQTQAWIREPYQGINLAWPPPHLIFSFRLQGEEERMQHQDVPFPSAAVRSSFSHCLSLRRANSFHPAADALAPRKRLRGRLEREEGLNRMRRDVTDWKRSEQIGSPKKIPFDFFTSHDKRQSMESKQSCTSNPEIEDLAH